MKVGMTEHKKDLILAIVFGFVMGLIFGALVISIFYHNMLKAAQP